MVHCFSVKTSTKVNEKFSPSWIFSEIACLARSDHTIFSIFHFPFVHDDNFEWKFIRCCFLLGLLWLLDFILYVCTIYIFHDATIDRKAFSRSFFFCIFFHKFENDANKIFCNNKNSFHSLSFEFSIFRYYLSIVKKKKWRRLRFGWQFFIAPSAALKWNANITNSNSSVECDIGHKFIHCFLRHFAFHISHNTTTKIM